MATRKKATTKAGRRNKVHKVMDEYKHGTLKSGKSGKGGRVRSRKQAIAIAMSESGQSKYGKKTRRKTVTKKTKKTASKTTPASRKKTTRRTSAR